MQLRSRNIEPHSKLLTLPMEVRAPIFRELLCLPTPIVDCGIRKHSSRLDKIIPGFDKQPHNRALYPQILRVCKQFLAEGQPLILTNTFGVEFWVDKFAPVLWSFAGGEPLPVSEFFGNDCSWWPMLSLAKPWKESLKLHMFIHYGNSSDDYEHEDDPLNAFECEAVRDQLEDVVKLLFTKQNFIVCDATFAILGLEEGYEPSEDTTVGLLQPLSLLRCKRAVITGVSNAYAARVASEMMSPTPAQNLYAMRDALQKYVRLFFPSCGDIDMPDEWNAVVDSVSAVNVGSFVACRVNTMQYLEKVREARVAGVFEHDGDIGQAHSEIDHKE